jgi:two-component system response regulator PhcR
MNSTPMQRFEKQSATILYVDDEIVSHKYFSRIFSEEYQILTASGADDAIDILNSDEHPIDILITDYQMPDRNGGDLLRQIELQFPHMVRILTTAYADKDVLLDSINSGGIFSVIEKPFNLDKMRETLRRAMELARERSYRLQRLIAIDETLSFLAHELRNPLSEIMRFLNELQNDEKLSKTQSETGNAVTSMMDNAHYCLSVLSSFTESVKQVSRVSPGIGYCTAHHLILRLLEIHPLSHLQCMFIRVNVKQDFRINALPNCVGLVLSSLLGNALRSLENQAAPSLCFTVFVDNSPQIRISYNGTGISSPSLQAVKNVVSDKVDIDRDTWDPAFCSRIMQSIGGRILIHSDSVGMNNITLDFPMMKNSAKKAIDE